MQLSYHAPGYVDSLMGMAVGLLEALGHPISGNSRSNPCCLGEL